MAEIPAMLSGRPAAPARHQPTLVDLPRPRDDPGNRRRPAATRGAMLALALVVLAGIVAAVLLSQREPATTGARPPTTSDRGTSVQPQLTAADLERAVTEYYALMPDRTDEGWERLGPGLQAQGKDSYEQFWKNVKDVTVVDAPRADADTVTVGIEFRVDGGDRIREVHRLGLLASGGAALIDSDQLVSSRRITGGDDKPKDKDKDEGEGNGNGNGRNGDGEND